MSKRRERWNTPRPTVAPRTVIAELRARGYTFVTVSRLMAPATPTPGTVYRP